MNKSCVASCKFLDQYTEHLVNKAEYYILSIIKTVQYNDNIIEKKSI